MKNNFLIIEIIKILIYKEESALLEKVDFNNDSVFLNPLLFAYFNNKKNECFSKNMLSEILQGFFLKKEPLKLKYSYNNKGISYVPNVGYFKNDKQFDDILNIEDFEILKEIHPVLEKYFVEFYKGHILNPKPEHNSVWQKNYFEFEKAVLIIKKYLPEFYKDLSFANKKVYLHDNPKILNFTSIETLGMLYFYVISKESLIYFIEELIHQGSHNFLYYVTHERIEYFKIDVDTIMLRDFTKEDWDYRTVYGAFHGLYTVTRRLDCFDILLSMNVFSGKQKHELLGRLADQFTRFRTGLELLNLDEVYTEKGKAFYEELDKKGSSVLIKYEKLRNEFDLSNRDLDFRYTDFCELNPYDAFIEKDILNYYKF